MDPWIILDHPHTIRQGTKVKDDDRHCSKRDGSEQCKNKENSKIQFDTMKMPCARGHSVHSWDILLDMGTQGLERDHVASTPGRPLQVTDSKVSVIRVKWW